MLVAGSCRAMRLRRHYASKMPYHSSTIEGPPLLAVPLIEILACTCAYVYHYNSSSIQYSLDAVAVDVGLHCCSYEWLKIQKNDTQRILKSV